MKVYKSLREIKSTIVEKDIERTKDLEVAETILKVAAHMGPYALQITSLPTHILYKVDYRLIPTAIRPIIANAMEILHRNLELRYKETVQRHKAATIEMRADPENRWLVEKFNSITQLRSMMELAVPSLKPKVKKKV